MAQHSNYLKTLKIKPISAKRLGTHIIEDIKAHFTEFKRCKEKQAIQDNNVFNFNKTDFQIRVVFGEVVVIPINCEAVYAADSNNKELITSIETINYSGRKVPTMIIFKGIYYLRKHFQNNIDSDTLFAYSPTGFSNNKLRLKYLVLWH